jgi:acetate kinase
MDPYIIPFLKNEGLSEEEILFGLSKNGGLLGVSGVSNDLRAVEKASLEGNARARLAVDVFVNSVVKYIGAFYAELGGLDNLVFTGGIGENSAAVRRRVCEAVKHLGIRLSEDENTKRCDGIRVISKFDSPARVLVIPANEEIGVARRTYEKVTGS